MRTFRHLRRGSPTSIPLVLAVALAVRAEAPTTFTGLGTLPGTVNSIARAVSADGRVVVGSSRTGRGPPEAFRWEDGVMTGLGFLPGATESIATAVSADGSVVVGYSGQAADGFEAFRWEDGVMTGLGFGSSVWSPSDRLWILSPPAAGVSTDGSVVVGSRSSGSAVEAVRWEAGVATGLGMLPGETSSAAAAVSADGSVVVGSSGSQPFRWEGGVMTGLGDLPGTILVSGATAVSADGAVVVGYRYTPQSLFEAFRWEDGVVEGLGFLDLGGSWALDVSADGSVVVGRARLGSLSGSQAFLWDEAHGMRDLRELLVDDHGLDLTGFQLPVASGVSDDGSTIVGSESATIVNSEALPSEGWIAFVPEPSAAIGCAAALAVVAGLARRRGGA